MPSALELLGLAHKFSVYELICPKCGFREFSTSIYTTCVRCGCFFYAAQTKPHSEESNG